MGLCPTLVPQGLSSAAPNPFCSLSPGFAGRRGSEWNRNSMWGISPLIHTKPAFLFSSFFTLLSSLHASCWVFSFAVLSSAGSCIRLTQAVVLCRAGGTSTCLCPILVQFLLLGSLPKKIPNVCTPACLAFTGRGEEPPSGNSLDSPQHSDAETRSGVTNSFPAPNS